MIATSERQCGTCAACCVYLKVPSIMKKALTPCHFLKKMDTEYTCGENNGCTNYDGKPDVCRDYRCSWLEGYGDIEDRPDKSGLLIDTMQRIGNSLECKPIWEGADKTEKGKQLIKRFSQQSQKVVLVTTYLETRLSYAVGEPVSGPISS